MIIAPDLNTVPTPVELSLIVAVRYYSVMDDLQPQFDQNHLKVKITQVSSLVELENELKNNTHDFIVTEYTLGNADIWKVAKLVNSSQLSQYAVPIIVLKDADAGADIPNYLAKEQGFTIVDLEGFGGLLKDSFLSCRSQGHSGNGGLKRTNTLLAIEDDEDAAELIRINLSDLYQVDIAHTGEAGLDLWLARRHDLVLLDYNLPSMQGDKVLDAIMSIDNNQPVIIMTAYDLPDRNRDMILHGASEYLCKPFEMDVLRERCLNILSKAKQIYHLSYTERKLEAVGNMLWLIDHYLSHNEYEKAKHTIAASRMLVPFIPPEDELFDLLDKEG
jgi:DNA-binding response OmpR family regulator